MRAVLFVALIVALSTFGGWMGGNWSESVRGMVIGAVSGGVLGFLLYWGINTSINQQAAWEAWCVDSGGRVDSTSKTSTGTGIGNNGQPITTTSTTTTYYCLTEDGRILDIR